MQVVQPAQTDPARTINFAAIFSRLAKFVAAALRPVSVETAIAIEYEGRNWCDETERALTQDMLGKRGMRY